LQPPLLGKEGKKQLPLQRTSNIRAAAIREDYPTPTVGFALTGMGGNGGKPGGFPLFVTCHICI